MISLKMLNKSQLEDLDISTLRYSEDMCKIDNYGKRLLSLCKSLDIHVANGRLGKENKVVKILLLLIIVYYHQKCSIMMYLKFCFLINYRAMFTV